MYRFNHVNGDPYCARLIRDRTGYRLTYPPCGVCGELISLGIVELFHGLHKSEIAFLYKVEEEHSLSDISFCDTYNKSEVCLNKLVLCFFVALCHALRKVKLALRLKKRNLAYLLQIHPDGVVYRKTLLLEHFFHILGGFELLDLDLYVVEFRRIDIICDLNAVILDHLIYLLDLIDIVIGVFESLHYIAVRKRAFCLTLFDKRFYIRLMVELFGIIVSCVDAVHIRFGLCRYVLSSVNRDFVYIAFRGFV